MPEVCDCGVLIQSHMEGLAELATKWCEQRNMEPTPLNIVRACSELGTIYRPAARNLILAYAEKQE